MKDELLHLLDVERPEVVKVVSWAASNGDRSENGDYQYGKKRLREIDRRIYFLTKRLEDALVVDPQSRESTDQVFFGATVCYADEDGNETTIAIVGVDEVNMDKNYVSWISQDITIWNQLEPSQDQMQDVFIISDKIRSRSSAG